MANLKVYPSGLTTYQPNNHPRNPPPRGLCKGWTKSATRRLVRFLYSVNATEISGLHSFSLTVRTCPSSSTSWSTMRANFFRRMHRLGATNVFWLTEWQRRGVPHLHGIIVLPEGLSRLLVIQEWVAATGDIAVRASAQDCKPIYDDIGWMEYLGKHSAKGVTNYQRSNSNIPKGWRGKTGRMWGKRGKWPTRPPIDFQFTERIFFKLRRLIRNRALSLARTRTDPGKNKSISYARRMLKSSDRNVSTVRGLSVFADIELALEFCDYLSTQGKLHQ